MDVVCLVRDLDVRDRLRSQCVGTAVEVTSTR